MKHLFYLSFMFFSSILFAQEKNVITTNSEKPINETVQPNQGVKPVSSQSDALANPRTANNSVRLESREPAKLPYDVDDKYMGRAEEFKGLFKTHELPIDFPLYEKQYGWGVKEYNAVVGAYLENNKALLTESVLKKLDKTSK